MIVKQFYKWFIKLSENLKTMALNNLKAKISNIETTIEDELPF